MGTEWHKATLTDSALGKAGWYLRVFSCSNGRLTHQQRQASSSPAISRLPRTVEGRAQTSPVQRTVSPMEPPIRPRFTNSPLKVTEMEPLGSAPREGGSTVSLLLGSAKDRKHHHPPRGDLLRGTRAPSHIPASALAPGAIPDSRNKVSDCISYI